MMLPSATTEGILRFSGITIPAESNIILIYRAFPNEFAPLSADGEITNTVTVSGGGIITAATAESTVGVCTEPDLEITKALSPAVINENGELTYTLTLLNYISTPADASDELVVTDTFNLILNPITVTFNGTPWVEGVNYTYNTATGEFVTGDNQLTVPAATITQDPVTGIWSVTPGTSTIVITGTV